MFFFMYFYDQSELSTPAMHVTAHEQPQSFPALMEVPC